MTPQVKSSYRLSTACAAVGILMIVGGVTGHSSGTAPHSQIASPNGAATAPAGELVQLPVTKAVQSQPVAKPPVTPGPNDSRKAQKPQKPQRPPIKPGPGGGGGGGFYKNCPEARTPGPPPNQGARPGQHSPFDRDRDGKPCEG